MKGFKVLVIMAVVLLLALGSLGTVLAANSGGTTSANATLSPGRPVNILGQIVSITPEDLSAPEHVLVLETRSGLAEVTTNADTQYRVLGVKETSLADFATGDNVVVRAIESEGGVIARVVHKVPGKGLLKQIRKHVVAGKVTDVQGANIILETPRGEVTVITNEDTRYQVPAVKDATLADIEIGDQIVAKGESTDAGFVAKLVIVRPRPGPAPLHLSGQVSDISGNTITVTDKDGNTFTINVPQGVTGIEPGQQVNVTIGNRPLAPGMAPQLRHQVEKFFKQGRGGLPGYRPGTPWQLPGRAAPQAQTSATTFYN